MGERSYREPADHGQRSVVTAGGLARWRERIRCAADERAGGDRRGGRRPRGVRRASTTGSPTASGSRPRSSSHLIGTDWKVAPTRSRRRRLGVPEDGRPAGNRRAGAVHHGVRGVPRPAADRAAGSVRAPRLDGVPGRTGRPAAPAPPHPVAVDLATGSGPWRSRSPTRSRRPRCTARTCPRWPIKVARENARALGAAGDVPSGRPVRRAAVDAPRSDRRDHASTRRTWAKKEVRTLPAEVLAVRAARIADRPQPDGHGARSNARVRRPGTG